ncbi:InlB B-repeat-containing protein [Rhodohalobacter sp. 8-1]|uniref:InlB B-repeat-containing protein n=1 Tax=Rhodohalobacter sp. 8-1 TaxID=3131972 RepID=UPI0030EDFAD8
MIRTKPLLITLMCFVGIMSCSTESTPVYTLTTTASPTQAGAITPESGSYDEGEVVSLQAFPNDGWVFVRWEQDMNATANPTNVTMNRDYTVVGVFERRMYSLTVGVEGEGTVTETVLQQKTTDYAEGTVVELQAIPAQDWMFNRWEGDLEGSGNPVEITIDQPINIIAYFSTIPTVSTSSVESINENSAQSGGNVTDDGGASVTERGVCWSLSQNPTTNDSCTSDGSGTGSFTSSLTNLSSDTQYFVRAYATNGAGTGYGEEISFTTRSEADSGDWPRDTETEVVDVTNPVTGRTWMDRNLGASRAATSMDDEEAYGNLYQWGRPADGHEKRNSSTTTTLSNSDQPGHGDYIIPSSGPYDWRSPQNGDLWQGVNGVNNPCPDNYRLPTWVEWEAERQSWSINNRDGAFESPLKLPVAGYRNYADGKGSFVSVGGGGHYWSSSVSVTRSRFLFFGDGTNAIVHSGVNRARAISVRCIKD